MKLVFNKNEKYEISVFSKTDDGSVKFKYIDMIKSLISVKQLEEPELIGEFSDSEKESISSMINHINTEITNFYSEGEE